MIRLAIAALVWICCSVNALGDAGNQRQQVLTENDLIRAADMGVELVEKLRRHESTIASTPIKVKNGSVSHGLLLENFPTTFSVQQNYFASMVLEGTEYLLNYNCKPFGLSAKQCGIEQPIPENSNLRTFCVMGARSQKHSKRGVHMYRRLLPNNYKDGVYKFPHSAISGELPNPRKITEALFLQSALKPPRIDPIHSIAVAQWAQFIEQDLARTVQATMRDGTPIECCNRFNRVAAPRSAHPSCHPLKILSNDTFYGKIHVSCLNYVRSALAVNPTCKFGPAEQLNQASNRLDLSQIYGITADERLKIRRFSGGKLKSDSQQLPPSSSDQCLTSTCFSSGDPRVNSNPYSYALHTMFLRFHNQLAEAVAHSNPTLSDEQIFQEARKMNIHVYQKIIYEEWAPVVLGRERAALVQTSTNGAGEKMVSNEFATVAIRFYNTMFPGDLMQAVDGNEFENNLLDATNLDPFAEQLFALQDVQFKPKKFGLDKIMAAVTSHHAMAVDTVYVDDLSNQLYRATQSDKLTFGSDSMALDILRSRDHGLAGYTKYLKFCSGKSVTSWNDLQGLINEQDLATFRKLYKTHEDIDLMVGALAEIPTKDATVGPTLQCIIADQLLNSKVNDPNFYTLYTKPAERNIIQYGARLCCETSHMSHVQGNIFLAPSPGNSLVKCSDMEPFELKISSPV